MKPTTSNYIATISIFVLILLICGLLYYVEKKSTSKTQWAELLESTKIYENVKDNKITTIIVDSKDKICEKENDMLQYHFTLEFIVYKYGDDGISEILLGFWPKKEATLYKDVKEMVDVSMAIIYEYIEKYPGNNGFTVHFNYSATKNTLTNWKFEGP